MYLSEQLQKKWGPILEHPDLGNIKDPYKRAVTTLLLENQEKAGVFKDYIRLSVGIEHEDDIILDIKNALEKI